MKKFSLGQVAMIRGVNGDVVYDEQFTKEVLNSLKRYQSGDWGDTCEEDAEQNDFAVENGERIFAVYITCKGEIWIITEWNRSATTILYPDEY